MDISNNRNYRKYTNAGKPDISEERNQEGILKFLKFNEMKT